MNTENLRLGFQRYLERKENSKNGGNDDIFDTSLRDDDASIFNHTTEFKRYLHEEMGADISVFSKSMNEIMEMQVIDGKLTDTQEMEDFGLMLDEAFSDDEAMVNSETDMIHTDAETVPYDKAGLEDTPEDSTQDDIKTSTRKYSDNMEQIKTRSRERAEKWENRKLSAQKESEKAHSMLNTLYDNKTAIKALDTDGDGVLSDEEKAKFEDYIKGYDNGKLSQKAVQSAYDDISKGEFSYDKKPGSKTTEKSDKTEKETNNNSINSANQAPSSGGGVSGGGGISYGGASNAAGISNAAANSVAQQAETETLPQLEEQRQKKQMELETAQDEVSKVNSGEDPDVKAAQNDVDSAKEEYDKVLEKVLDEEDEKDAELKEKRDSNLEAISNKETEISDTQQQIADFDSEIFNLNSEIAAAESNISALEASAQALAGAESDDAAAKRTEVGNQLTAAKQALEQKQAALSEAEKSKSEAEQSLNDKQDELAELQEEKTAIEEDILKNCPKEDKKEVKAAMEAYDTAKENLQNVKETKLQTAQDKVSQIQSEITQLDAKINEKKAQETQDKNKPTGEFANLFDNSAFKDGALAGMGGTIEELCEKYNVDPALASAIIASETGWGTSSAIVKQNNPGGYMDPATNWSTVKTFGSLEEGLEAVISNLSSTYISQGLNTIQTIGNVYCPVGAANDPTGLNANWVPTVTQIYNQLSGKNITKDTRLG